MAYLTKLLACALVISSVIAYPLQQTPTPNNLVKQDEFASAKSIVDAFYKQTMQTKIVNREDRAIVRIYWKALIKDTVRYDPTVDGVAYDQIAKEILAVYRRLELAGDDFYNRPRQGHTHVRHSPDFTGRTIVFTNDAGEEIDYEWSMLMKREPNIKYFSDAASLLEEKYKNYDYQLKAEYVEQERVRIALGL